MLKKILAFLLFLFIYSSNIFAQAESVEMADTMRSNGKIYVVVGVIAIVFTGIIIYLISVDRKVSKLEKKFDDKN